MLTCKDFLQALNEYLDETEDADIRKEVEAHINECPNCWVVFDTTQKTLRIYKGLEPQGIPDEVHTRLMNRLQQRIEEKGRVR